MNNVCLRVCFIEDTKVPNNVVALSYILASNGSAMPKT